MFKRPGLVIVAFLLVCVGSGFLLRDYSGVGGEMTQAAESFVATLKPEQREMTVIPFEDGRRLDWHFIPKPSRKGFQVKDMNDEQRKKAHALLRSGLSELGYDKAVTIMDVESILHELEKSRKGGNIRDPLRYYVTIFGQPDLKGQWGWSFEGHHLSLNYVVNDGKCTSVTPSFFGINPAEIKQQLSVGPKKGTRVLAKREELAFDLLKSLDDEQRKVVVIAEKAPSDIRGAAKPQPVDEPIAGLPASKMNDEQRKGLRALLTAYTDAMPDKVAAQRWSEIEQAGMEKIHFAWAGPDRPGIGHHYVVQGPTFVVEFNNTQPDSAGNPANHIHSMWRQMDGDFGLSRK